MAYRILSQKCTGCGECLEQCPMEAISLDATEKYVINPDTCTDCGSCADICPSGAIRGT